MTSYTLYIYVWRCDSLPTDYMWKQNVGNVDQSVIVSFMFPT